MQGHIRRRETGSWEYTIDIGRAPAQRCQSCGRRFWVERRPQGTCPHCGGKLVLADERRRETKGGYATRREAQAAMSKVAVAVEEQTHVANSRLTLREYLTKEWLPAIEHTIRPTTYRSYVAHVECHILSALGSVQLQKLAPAQINALYAKLTSAGKRNGKGLTALSVRHVHAVLHRSLKDAVRWGRLARNPADLADPPRVAAHSHELRTWSAEQLASFLNSQRDDRLCALWHTLAMTGLRRGEALGLRWQDVDFEAGRLCVRRSLIPEGSRVAVHEPKTAHGRRVVALDPETVAALKGQAARQLADQAATEGWDDTDLVFTDEQGQALHPWLVSRCFRKAVRETMMPDIRLHDLRHTHATLALQAGIHPKVVSERLGHATVSTTLDTYSHAIPAMQQEAAQLIAALVFVPDGD
jgi:integrase